MKITRRDNGTAKLLFMKHERDIFRGVGGMSHFPHLPENIEYDTVTKYKAEISFFPVILHGDYYGRASVFAEVDQEREGTSRFSASSSTQCEIKHVSIILLIKILIDLLHVMLINVNKNVLWMISYHVLFL